MIINSHTQLIIEGRVRGMITFKRIPLIIPCSLNLTLSDSSISPLYFTPERQGTLGLSTRHCHGLINPIRRKDLLVVVCGGREEEIEVPASYELSK